MLLTDRLPVLKYSTHFHVVARTENSYVLSENNAVADLTLGLVRIRRSAYNIFALVGTDKPVIEDVIWCDDWVPSFPGKAGIPYISNGYYIPEELIARYPRTFCKLLGFIPPETQPSPSFADTLKLFFELTEDITAHDMEHMADELGLTPEDARLPFGEKLSILWTRSLYPPEDESMSAGEGDYYYLIYDEMTDPDYSVVIPDSVLVGRLQRIPYKQRKYVWSLLPEPVKRPILNFLRNKCGLETTEITGEIISFSERAYLGPDCITTEVVYDKIYKAYRAGYQPQTEQEADEIIRNIYTVGNNITFAEDTQVILDGVPNFNSPVKCFLENSVSGGQKLHIILDQGSTPVFGDTVILSRRDLVTIFHLRTDIVRATDLSNRGEIPATARITMTTQTWRELAFYALYLFEDRFLSDRLLSRGEGVIRDIMTLQALLPALFVNEDEDEEQVPAVPSAPPITDPAALDKAFFAFLRR